MRRMLLVTLGLWLGGCSSVSGPPGPRGGAGGEPATGGASGEVEPDARASVEADSLLAETPDTSPAKPDALLADLVLADSRPDARVLADSLLADTGPAMPEACAVPKVLVYGNACAKSWTGTKIACVPGCISFDTKEAVQEKLPCSTTGSERDLGGWTGRVICIPSSNDCAKFCTTPIN